MVNLRNETSSLKVELPDKIAGTVVNDLRQHFVVNGVAPIALHDLDSRMIDMETRITARFCELAYVVVG
ncbi:hypothetical protein PHMEG_00029496 [Phytophthora megakarya]|uniref:Uncharacterized protein n=1 Tax=Phytophthora megakarya TaxID=4795 RepID=A0A225V2H8_9STRA|nr:hypothetical protein PHMEG_00029496 [Phytophthora megakarya]